MTIFQAVILGIVQGLTEYLPVSSSAHLVIVPKLLGWQFSTKEAFVFDVLVQLGTLVGVLFYFHATIKEVIKSAVHGLLINQPFVNENARLGYMVALATVPAAVLGLLFKDEISHYFSSPRASCSFLMVTGIILLLAEYAAYATKLIPSLKNAFVIGCAQGLALLPGISRSGATISAGMMCGLSRNNAAKFSFLMSIPIMLAASLVTSRDLIEDADLMARLALPLVIGFASAAISGYLVIKWFMVFLSKQRLNWFAFYCLGVGLLGSLYF